MSAADAEEPLFVPPDWLDREEEVLAPYAMRTRLSKGRHFPDDAHPYRTLYQRDRDRIVHSTAFRRLMYKTQVLVHQTNDHHRTRLTHTLEVAQISRTIARQLGLNEDLTESIALSHDLGHPPFGHAGEEALDECMRDFGGFEHNRHAFRIVTELEYRYAEFPGLNLSWEALEAMALPSKRRCPRVLVGPGPDVHRLKADLERFLHQRVYRHYRVIRMQTKGRRFIGALFDEYCRVPQQLPERYARRAVAGALERTVCDYIAG